MTKQEFKHLIDQAMIADRFRLQKKWQHLSKQNSKTKNDDWTRLENQLTASIDRVAQRLKHLPQPGFDQNLPVCERRAEIAKIIEQHQVLIIAGETGSGKTTQLPKICLELKRGIYGQIAHTQPRRLATRSVAERIAEELKTSLGEQVGYKVRFTDQVQADSYIKLMTDGILLAETQGDRFLEAYDTLIIDEAHERSLNIDFLLGYIKRILPKRPDLKVIITSATIDVERFSEHFDHAPIIEVSGRTFPVEVHYRPLNLNQDGNDTALPQAVLAAVDEAIQLDRDKQHSLPGDMLIFCSGERDIRELADHLRKFGPPHTDILPLYARLSAKDQHRIFESHRGRRIIISTNVAETSLTVPNIRYVIDTGTARISRYSYRSKVQRLPIEAISQASANQRKGRCGRVSAGVCFRLYSEEDFLSRAEFTTPEILRTNLAAVILQMENLKLGKVEDFPFLDKPEPAFIKDGYRLLNELGAINEQGQLTPLGKNLAKLPADPRMGRMILAANEQHCLREILIITSALSAQDPRDRPHEKRQAADQSHQQYQHKQSDFLSFVNLWDSYEQQRQTLSQKQLRKYCKDNFLSYLRMREWRDTHHQLKIICKQLSFKENQQPAEYADIHKALLTGLLSQIGHKDNKDNDQQYLGARNTRFNIFPGSTLAKKQAPWIIAAELLETSKLFAHHVAVIEPEWIEPIAKDLVKHSYSDPVWQKNRGEVVAKEKSTLYGLVLQAERFRPYKTIDPSLCRELFIRDGLVAQAINTQGAFLKHNQNLIAEVEQLENKARCRDILVHEQELCDFYQSKIPVDICTQVDFEKWRKQAEKTQPKLLFIKHADLLKRQADDVSEAQFPNHLHWEGLSFPLKYHFEPGHKHDGVTLITPISMINQIPVKRLEWLVPGMLRDKCIALIKALPKKWRRNFIPVPDVVDRCLKEMSPGDYSLTQQLSEQLKKVTGIVIPEEEWLTQDLDPHYLFNIAIVNEQGQIQFQNRDIKQIKQQAGDAALATPAHNSNRHELERDNLNSWDFPDLPDYIACDQAGVSVRRYPALIDKGNSVSLVLMDAPATAHQHTRAGLRRLIILNLPQQIRHLKKNFSQLKSMTLNYRSLGSQDELLESLINTSVDQCFQLEQQHIKSHQAFETLLAEKKSALTTVAQQLEIQADDILKLYQSIHEKLKGKIPLTLAEPLTDIKTQLQNLIYPDFLINTPKQWLQHYPRYLNAIINRLEKLNQTSGDKLQKDTLHTRELKTLWQQYQTRLKQHQLNGETDPELETYRWMLEEYRVSLFAQELKTTMPISAKRLSKQWQAVKV